eukprot:NODE_315_length_1052_cov_897.949153_g253_i0.p1 GENE.NODE_315_length_1052_cov_897.949153_g253_i0~~NODE_315_length_1052_cov_897.949153_g253_i0.p1  ORF type:complete len:102 (+),score=1.08 NODE_315_length_1052_cov_897.949153_g253_i0:583-888(+)
MNTAEEIIQNHPYLRTWIDYPDDDELRVRVMTEEHAIWAMEEYANQFKPTSTPEEMAEKGLSIFDDKKWYGELSAQAQIDIQEALRIASGKYLKTDQTSTK